MHVHVHVLSHVLTDWQVRPFSSGPPAPFAPHVLDLGTMEWRVASDPQADVAADLAADVAADLAEADSAAVAFKPAPRLRFACEIVGRHLLVYSGHGDRRIPESERLIRLDVGTLRWERLRVLNRPASYPDTPAAALAGGILCGGVQVSTWPCCTAISQSVSLCVSLCTPAHFLACVVQMTAFGIRPCAKFDVVCLAEPPFDESDEAEIKAEVEAKRATGLSGGAQAEGRWEGGAISEAAAGGQGSGAIGSADDDDGDGGLSDDFVVVAIRSGDHVRHLRIPREVMDELRRSGAMGSGAMGSGAMVDDNDDDDDDDDGGDE